MFYFEQTSQPARQTSVWLCGQAYLEPLPVGLHLEDDARVRLRQSISVGNAFARHTQLDLGQAGAVKDPQRVGSRLVNVAHLLHSVLENKKGEENDAPVTAIFFKGGSVPVPTPIQETVRTQMRMFEVSIISPFKTTSNFSEVGNSPPYHNQNKASQPEAGTLG